MKWFMYLIFFVLFLGASFFVSIRFLNYFPKDIEKAELVCDGKEKKELKPGESLKLLVWNVQYSASRKYHFFYDDGKDVIAEKKVVEKTIEQIAAVVKEVQPDIILWQELDRGSDRTHRTDQLKEYLQKYPMGCYAATSYHRSAYLPHPSHKHLGKVDMQLSVFSKIALKKATRFQLPMLKESFFRRAFNLKRAVLEVEIPMTNGKSLFLLDTHFSAFSFGDGTMEKQVKKAMSLIEKHEKANNLWIFAGDLNLLPPGVDPKSLGKDAKYYSPTKSNPINPLFAQYLPALSVAEYNKNPSLYNTYLPWETKKTDRWIDHVFLSKKIKVKKYEVLQKHWNISDHLPVVVEIELPKE